MTRARFVVLTGVSGSGKKTALHAFEDLGFFCVENLPAPLVPGFVDFVLDASKDLAHPQYRSRSFALLIDCRDEYDYSESSEFKQKIKSAGLEFSLLFFDAQDDVLLRRFKETRRPHPFSLHNSKALNTQDAIHKERELLASFRAEADLVVDTTTYSPHDLRRRMEEYLSARASFELRLQSFGFKHGLPNDADLVADVRFLANPHFVEGMREKNGLNQSVAAYVLNSQDAKDFLAHYSTLLKFLIPKYQAEGKRMLNIAIGCTGGRHRSVAVAQALFEELEKSFANCKIEHRDI